MATPQNSVFECMIKYVVNGQVCRNVWHYRNSAPFVTPTPKDVAIQLSVTKMGLTAGHFPPEFAGVMSTDAVFDEASVQPIYPVRWRRIQASLSPLSGGIAQDCEAQNVAGVISKFGELATRRELGSMHVGGVPEGMLNAGELDPAYVTMLDGLATTLFTPFNLTVSGETVSMVPCILNKANEGTPEDPDWQIVGSAPIDDWDVQNEIRTMRSRTKGRGE